MSIYIHDMISALSKNYKHYGLNVNEFVVLNNIITENKIKRDFTDIGFHKEIAGELGLKWEEVTDILIGLIDKEKIVVNENSLNLQVGVLYNNLLKAEEENKPLTQRLSESMYISRSYNGDVGHIGMVELRPEDEGISVNTNDGYLWTRKQMIELANEILNFTNHFDDEDIKHNNDKQEKKIAFEQAQRELRWKENQEIKKEKKKPQSGVIVIFKIFPSGHYKFSYSVSLSVETKIANLKEEYGNIQVIHSLEVYDTMKFYHQFLKKQFSNRSVDTNRNSEFKLTEEDIKFIQEEKYPSNAMEWAFGTITTQEGTAEESAL